ncbi:MAG: FAD-dependent oxidoreductase [Pseudonocardiaceae bacterium]
MAGIPLGTPLRVLVIGGGIGGLALGQALVVADVDVQIHERNRNATDWLSGYRLNINPNGARALHQCLPEPLWEAFVATSVATPAGITFRTERLTELLTLGRDAVTGGSDDPASGQYGVSRVVLRNLLLAGLGDIVRFGATFERYTVGDDSRITAHFTDGSTATGDVLIGADGANSRVRAQYLPRARRLDTGAVSIAGRLPLTARTRSWLPEYLAAGMALVMAPVGRSMFTAAFAGRQRLTEAIRHGHDLAGLGVDPELLLDDLEDYVLWSVIVQHGACPAGAMAGAAGLDGAAGKRVAQGMVRDWHPALRRIVAETDPTTVRLLRFKRSTLIESWASSPVTVMGDAVHNMPPVGGLGANTALRDAAELSSRLVAARDRADLIAAIAGYEARMREYGYAAVRAAARNTERAISSNPLTRRMSRGWFRLCRAVPALKRRSFGAEWDDSPQPQTSPVRSRL